MKSYFTASAVAALACAYVVVGADAPVPAAAAAARSAAWPAVAPAMACLPESRWLLRAMSAAGCAGTLAPSPCELPADTKSL